MDFCWEYQGRIMRLWSVYAQHMPPWIILHRRKIFWKACDQFIGWICKWYTWRQYGSNEITVMVVQIAHHGWLSLFQEILSDIVLFSQKQGDVIEPENMYRIIGSTLTHCRFDLILWKSPLNPNYVNIMRFFCTFRVTPRRFRLKMSSKLYRMKAKWQRYRLYHNNGDYIHF